MDTLFYKNYYKYFLWNNGLIDHFFSKGDKEILLHIDHYLLKEIGQKAGIVAEDYEKDFLLCVESFCANYNNYVCPQNNPNGDNYCPFSDCKYHSNSFCLKSSKRKDVLLVANHIYSKGIKYYKKYTNESGDIKIRLTDEKKAEIHELPFFAIVVYVILRFDNGKTQEWVNVGKDITAQSRTYIKELWKIINSYDDRFDQNASVYDRTNSEYEDYAGRILYHLPLSATTRNKIQDAIYKSSSWKLVSTKSFWEIVGHILHSLKDIRANNELNEILLNCYSSSDYKGISARKVQSVIDDFDIDKYEQELAQRRASNDYNHTIISGSFALGIRFPEDNSNNDAAIVLLTTVQQSIAEGDFIIKEGQSGTLAGYNTSFVKINNSIFAELKDYSLRKKNYNIVSLPCENVIFFYEYDQNLYIQTRDIKPAKSYIVAVRNDYNESFKEWCSCNNNSLEQWPIEDTQELFGCNWTIYYSEDRLNGQYYDKGLDQIERKNESTTIVKKGGIFKNNSDIYFINALPYFEVPEIYDINAIKIYINLNGIWFGNDNYRQFLRGRNIIIDILKMPKNSDDIAVMDICLECDSKTRFTYSIRVCGQRIDYDSDGFYKYNRFGVISSDQNSIAYFGNNIKTGYQYRNVTGLFQISKERIDMISDDLYLTNLLAACCYDSATSEISHDKFRKCISYAATRLNVDIQRDGFIRNVKNLLVQAGIVNINYADKNKCQALPPSFMKVPFSSSVYQTSGSQMMMLCGCYTRSFIADLFDYCIDNKIDLYAVRNDNQKDEESMLPPIILIGPKFDPSDFRSKYSQKCDILNDYDFALSLISIIPRFNDIKSKFVFRHNDSHQFLSKLDESSTDVLPRIRTMSDAHHKNFYIERSGYMFAEVQNGYLPWASMFCNFEITSPFVFVKGDNSVLIPTSLLLPNYVQRALYLMNLGLPKQAKVFVRGNKKNDYYSLMNEYKLSSRERCLTLCSKITGDRECHGNSVIYRDIKHTNYKMEFWVAKLNGDKRRKKYLVLFDKTQNNGIFAIAYEYKVYLKCNGSFNQIDSDSMNEVLCFLIEKNWQFDKGYRSIGISKNFGDEFEKVFNISSKSIEIPDRRKYIINNIQIA